MTPPQLAQGRLRLALFVLALLAVLGCASKKSQEAHAPSGHPAEEAPPPTMAAPPPTTAGAQPPTEKPSTPKTARPAAADTLPEFPLPPPEPTLRYVIPRQLLIEQGDSLGSVFDRIVQTLRHGGFDMWSVFSAGPGGFAVVCRLEHIGEDGRRVNPPFSTQPPPHHIFNPLHFLKALFLAERGRYRVIVLLLQPQVEHNYRPPPAEEEMSALLRSGANDLPDAWRSQPAEALRPEALIYEFFQPGQHAQAQPVKTEESHLTAVQHLVGAGLWAEGDLQ